MSATTYGWLVLAFPLAGSLVCALGYRRLPGRSAGWIATGAIFAAFISAIGALWALLDHSAHDRELTSALYHNASADGLDIQLGILVDPLSVFMALVVSGVSALIHLYSVTYMASDRGYARYFAYLNFFVFSMLLLVLAGNFLILIIGWAFVGAASYLLISFWYRRRTATAAGIKAFVINVVGDVGLVLGTFFILRETGSVDFLRTFEAVPEAFGRNDGDLVAGCILLLVGAFAKSAQVPLHTWLPDAMEGPTPVSALIHAATMVTAGVYLVARANVLFEVSEVALGVVAIVGLFTAVYAGLAALGQDDLKRVLAYSTISQLGYMFLAAGVGAYAVAIFHLVAHAFFKALLFLAAGSVMHATDGEIDVTRLGGLRKRMPVTATFFAIGGLALAGIPLLAGFFSKDQVLAVTYEAGRTGLWIVGLLAAGLTAVYIARAYALTFEGAPRRDLHPHEAPALMVGPMAVLAGLTVGGGLLGLSIQTGRVQSFLAPVFGHAEHAAATGGLSELVLSVIASLVAATGLAIGWYVYGSGRVDVWRMRKRYAGTKRALESGLYVDELYGRGLVLPGRAAASFTASVVDQRVIDGAANGLGRAFAGLAGAGRKVQTGFVRTYALSFLVGAASLLVLLVARS